MTHVSMTQGTAKVIVGVDTHADIHVAAALDPLGRLVGRLEIPTTPSGYSRLLSWSRELDADVVFGIAVGFGATVAVGVAGATVGATAGLPAPPQPASTTRAVRTTGIATMPRVTLVSR